jgi:DNA anti-recombination protein RmuC
MADTKPLNFEKVWQMFQETREQMREQTRETDRKIRETHRAIDRLSSRQGELIEHIGDTVKINAAPPPWEPRIW